MNGGDRKPSPPLPGERNARGPPSSGDRKSPTGSPGSGNPQDKRPQPYRPNPFSWLILAALLAWNIWAFIPRHSPEVTLPYSVFVAQVASGNVSEVRIVGDAISGTFVRAIKWPEPAANTKPAPTTQQRPAAPQNPVAHSAPAKAPPAVTRAPGAPPNPSTPANYMKFRAIFPSIVGDTSLMPLLQAHRVVINVSTPSPPWFAILLTDGMPVLLMVALLLWMGRQASRTQSGVFGFARNKARRYTEDRPKVTFADVAGADEAKKDLTEVVDFLKHPSKYLEIGARIPRGVLLVGPPGTGKTLLARAVAGEAGAPFFHISGSEFVEMFVGVGASRVRDLFTQAKAAQPAIVFVDELDAVGRRRGAGLGAVNDEREQTLNQLLVEMDGFDERQQVILLAATNRPDVLDPALLRPGRFDRQVVVPLPDWRGREGILRIHTRHLRLATDVNLERIARTATGLSGADLANLCNEAALGAARHNRTEVTEQDFDQAWDKIVLGAERAAMLTPHDRRVVAYHEGGHAVVAWLTPAADPVRKVTIVPHGRALGVTEQLPTEERYNMSRGDLLARLDVMLGGRASEALVIGEITTGAENDLIQATRLARRMITRWGMGTLGPVAFDSQDENPFLGYQIAQGRDYSEATAARIDREVEHLLSERQDVVQHLLAGARERLDTLAARLLKDETIGDTELARILGPRPSLSAEPSPATAGAL
ncbi:MAG TPA: ATP-dependent zinc metalloprotease FtsH [Steroidobacteraceae bacterium]|nr:ATP-dependent zinc metalloprotease FtsH [Steroidobacteraceae bacterium]